MVNVGSEGDMEEKIKDMSPEQLKDFQKQNCIFCQIVSGKVQSKKIYEDNRCIAILDINPANPGHILLLPKEHYAVMPQMPEEEIGYLFMVSKALSSAMLKALKAEGTNIFVANGVAAGQRAQHFMMHIIPRRENDGITAFNIPQRQMPDSDLEKIKKVMANAVAKIMGLRAPDAEEAGKTETKPEVAAQKEEHRKNRDDSEQKEKRDDTEKERQCKKSGKEEEQKKKIEGKIKGKAQIKAEKIDLDKIAGIFR